MNKLSIPTILSYAFAILFGVSLNVAWITAKENTALTKLLRLAEASARTAHGKLLDYQEAQDEAKQDLEMELSTVKWELETCKKGSQSRASN